MSRPVRFVVLFLVGALGMLASAATPADQLAEPSVGASPKPRIDRERAEHQERFRTQKKLGEHRRESADFWIGDSGPTGPLFTGPQQYPFICFTWENGLGQPLIDNADGVGNAVFPEVGGVPDFTASPLGYSRYCSIATRVDYVYYSRVGNDFLPLPDPAHPPADVATLTLDGKSVNFVVRLERGTINRFIYGIAMLAPYAESLASPKTLDNSAWNGKLVYKFQGGVGIGHWQGAFSLDKENALHYEALARGYAVAYSTGTVAATHYNLRLSEETALMVKGHFESVYGRPRYTIGLGGSGGAIQQYVLAQNNRRLLDGAIPQLSFPDMITQTIHIGDCELLERYFDMDALLDPASRWKNWLERRKVEGLNTSATAYAGVWRDSPYAPRPGSSECIQGWRGLVPLAVNPAWTDPAYLYGLQLYRYPPEVIAGIKWTHWDDLANIYPADASGYRPNSWDNVGVQYGLNALVSGGIGAQEFLDLNACVGGWKQPQEMTANNFPWNLGASPATYDPWHAENMNLNPACKLGAPAPRTAGNLTAMHLAYDSGHVFTGDIDIPVIDMHHAQGSFAVRARLRGRDGEPRQQSIWFAECSHLDLVSLASDCAYNPTGDALDAMDQWLTQRHGRSRAATLKGKPRAAEDRCLAGDGGLIYAGADAWDGILDRRPPGPCTQRFPIFATSRMAAGDDLSGERFKCALKPVDTALADGTYGGLVFSETEITRLKAVFPDGVCDYRRPDVGR
jgi:hypothetical protein